MMATRVISVVALFSLLMLWKPAVVKCNQNLTFMFITSFGRFGLNSSGAVPAADIALEAINADPNILPGYNLVYDQVRDSEVSQPRVCYFINEIIMSVATEWQINTNPIATLKPELSITFNTQILDYRIYISH